MLSKAATLEQAASKSKLKEKIEPLENRFNQLCTQALDQAASEGRKEEYDFLNSILKPDNKPNLKERKTDGSLATEIAYKKVKDKLEELESILEHSDKILSAKNLDLIVVKRDSYSEQERVEMETNLLKLQVQLIEAKLLSNYSNWETLYDNLTQFAKNFFPAEKGARDEDYLIAGLKWLGSKNTVTAYDRLSLLKILIERNGELKLGAKIFYQGFAESLKNLRERPKTKEPITISLQTKKF